MIKEPDYITKPDITQGGSPRHILRWQTILAVLIGGLFFALSASFIWANVKPVSLEIIYAQFETLTPLHIALACAFAVLSFIAASFEDLGDVKLGSTASKLDNFLSIFIANAVSNVTDMGSLAGANIKTRLFGIRVANPMDQAKSSALSQWAILSSGLVLCTAGVLVNLTEFETLYPVSKPWLYGFVAIGVLALLGATVFKAYLFSLETRRFWEYVISLLLNGVKWVTAAATLYVCLHDNVSLSFTAILPLYIIAHSIGRLSGLPAGFGVFEASCFLLFQNIPPQNMIVALIAYRFIYFAGPLLLSALILGIRKAFAPKIIATGSKALKKGEQVFDVFEQIAPPLFAILTFLSGAVMLISAATPDKAVSIPLLGAGASLVVVEISHLLASILATVLLIIAIGLRRRLRNAWGLAVISMLSGALFTILKGGDLRGALILGVLAVTLYASKDAFYRKGQIRNIPLNWPRLALIAGTLSFAIWVGFYAYLDEPYSNSLWWDFGQDNNVSRFLRASVAIGTLFSLYALWRFLQAAPNLSQANQSSEDLAAVKRILETAERPGSESNLALMGDKRFLFSKSKDSFIMYGIKGRNWVAMGNPVGLKSERKELIWAFRQLADQWDGWPCFYAVRGDDLTDFVDAGIALQKIGELASISLGDFSMEGKKRSELRNSKSRALREGCSFDIIYPNSDDAIMDRLETVSQHWLNKHQGKEKRFSLGRFDRDVLADQAVAVIERDGVIIAFANLWTTADKSEISVDLMRYEDVKINGLMDFLFVEIMLWAKAQGYHSFGLGMAPLAGLEGDRLAPFMSKIGALIFEHGGRFYGFKGLRAFKQKFHPTWEPVYLAAPNQLTMPIALGNLALLSSGGVLGLLQK